MADLDHSPAKIIQRLLISRSLGTDPSDAGSWPVYSSIKPDKPNALISVVTTANRNSGRNMVDGEVWEHYGCQLMFRHAKSESAYTKAQTVITTLDTYKLITLTVTDPSPTGTYTFYNISRVGGVLALGYEEGTKRHLYSANIVSTLRQTA